MSSTLNLHSEADSPSRVENLVTRDDQRTGGKNGSSLPSATTLEQNASSPPSIPQQARGTLDRASRNSSMTALSVISELDVSPTAQTDATSFADGTRLSPPIAAQTPALVPRPLVIKNQSFPSSQVRSATTTAP